MAHIMSINLVAASCILILILILILQGGGDPSSLSECRACGVQYGCPASSPMIIDPPPALAHELGTASNSEPPGSTGDARAVLLEEETIFPLITRPPANSSTDFHQQLEQQLPRAPLLVEQAPNYQIPTTPSEPTLIAAAFHQLEQQAAMNPAARQYMGENSAPPPPPPPPQSSLPDHNEVPIQRVVDIERDYPPPGHRPFGGEDLQRRRSMRRPLPGSGSQGRGYEYISLISDLGRQRCRQYYPNDNYLNNRPWYRRVGIWNNGHNSSSNCELLPRTRTRARDQRGPAASSSFPDGAEGSNDYVPAAPPLRRWNTFPVRENQYHHEEDQLQAPGGGPAAGPSINNNNNNIPAARQPAGDHHQGSTVVQDNIVIGDPTKVRIGEGNRGGRSTRGRVTGNVVMR